MFYILFTFTSPHYSDVAIPNATRVPMLHEYVRFPDGHRSFEVKGVTSVYGGFVSVDSDVVSDVREQWIVTLD